MVFGIAIGNDGQPICLCCRDKLWHCLKCWNKNHFGKEHKDYTPPEYFGQSMMDEDIAKKMEEDYGIKQNPKIKPDKDREYEEGIYRH